MQFGNVSTVTENVPYLRVIEAGFFHGSVFGQAICWAVGSLTSLSYEDAECYGMGFGAMRMPSDDRMDA